MYHPQDDRYKCMEYRKCGSSGLKLPVLSLGLWHNFGDGDSYENAVAMLTGAFDIGITHFDLANNYGPSAGSAELTFGRIMKEYLSIYRDELVISSKAGFYMWPGPYGDGGSRKYLIASCDQSLKRTGLEYFDIFYHHCPDLQTPIAESMEALAQLVRSGKALYVGISNYNVAKSAEALQYCRANQIPLIIDQVRFNMFDRTFEEENLFNSLADSGMGSIIYSPLAQGILTDRYLHGIPADSRATRKHFLKPEALTQERMTKVAALNELATDSGMTLAGMAIGWVLSHAGVTSALVGASRLDQIKTITEDLQKPPLNAEMLEQIEKILA